MAATQYKLKVGGRLVCETPKTNGQHVQQGVIGQVSLVSYKADYDNAAELVIRVDRDIWSPAFPPDSGVELYVNGVRRFCGHSGPAQPSLHAGTAATQRYVCRDPSYALRQCAVLDKWDGKTITLKGGKLAAVLAEYLPFAQTQLERVGIEPVFDYANGAADAETLPVTIQSGTVDSGFREIAASALGVRCIIDPSGETPRYRFVRVYGSPSYDLTFETVRVPEFDLQISLEGRCGAVRTLRGTDRTNAEATDEHEMTPAWTVVPNEATTWHAQQVDVAPLMPAVVEGQPPATPPASTALKTDETFRRWSFAAFADSVQKDSPMIAVCYSDEDDVPPRFIEIIETDWDAMTVLLKFPAVADRPHKHHFGRDYVSKGASRCGICKLRHLYRGEVVMVFPAMRVPAATGFGGRAYAMAPVTCGHERLIEIPGGVDRDTYAYQAFAVYSEPVCEGRIPINGDLPAELWALDRRINVRRDSGESTGYEQLLAPLMGVSVEFERGGTATLEFSTDTSMLLRGGEG